MVLIRGGTFKMGDIQGKGGGDEKPVHEVTLDDFFIGRYEVTVKQYLRCAETGACREPAWREPDGIFITRADRRKTTRYYKQQLGDALTGENYPIVGVSWTDAKTYAEWLSKQTGKEYRLPTEAEWEYAAKAGSETAYHFGNDAKRLGEHAWYSANSGGKTHLVGQKRPNVRELYDMHGNVWEWVADWYDSDYYAKSFKKNPVGPELGSNRVIRGGSWSFDALTCRSTYRSGYDPGNHLFDVGFRLARRIP